jgi:Putative DNA-binding domain
MHRVKLQREAAISLQSPSTIANPIDRYGSPHEYMKRASKILGELSVTQMESGPLDFKSAFDPASKQEWCEIIKDIAAMANSGGGIIIIGVNDDGTHSGADISNALKLDAAQITDKLSAYTSVQFSAFEIRSTQYAGQTVAAICIGRSETPLVFAKPGTYPIVGEKHQQKTAFSQGTIYFRHGAKSEPATSEDLRKFIERVLKGVAKSWRRGIRKVVTAPAGHEIRVVPPNMKIVSNDEALPIRLVHDPAAQASRFVNPDETHPYRQKELITELRRQLEGKAKPTTHDILCLRRIHRTDDDLKFTFVPKYGSRQYSSAFADWIVEQYKTDPDFFKKACDEHGRQQTLARRKKNPR